MGASDGKPVFHWSRKFKAFAFKGTPLRGVHPTMRSCFYPNYTYEAAKFGPTTPTVPRTGVYGVKVTKHKPGTKAGMLVDTELKRTVNLSVKYNLSASVFCSHMHQLTYAAKKRQDMTDRDTNLLKMKLAPATAKIWQTFHRFNLVPEDTQVVVGCKDLGVATAADVVCRDTHGRKVVIEIKTGFMSYYMRYSPFPLTGGLTPTQNDSPANQHQLQIFITHELYRRTFPNVSMGQGLVMRVDGLGVDVTPIQDWVISNASLILRRVQASKTQSCTVKTKPPKKRDR